MYLLNQLFYWNPFLKDLLRGHRAGVHLGDYFATGGIDDEDVAHGAGRHQTMAW